MKKLKHTQYYRSRGINLISLVMWLFIASFILLAILIMFISSSESEKSNESIQELTAIVSSVHSAFQGQTNYSTLVGISDILVNGHFPAKWIRGNQLINPFGLPVILGQQNGQYMVVTFNGIPSPVCVKMLTSDFGTSMVSVQTNSISMPYQQVLKPLEANNACVSSSNSNSIVWKFL